MGAMKDYDRRIRQGGDDAIAAVGELVPRWTPVAERLPAAGCTVLAWGRPSGQWQSPHASHAWHVARVDEDGRWRACGRAYDWPYRVTHWMPLPAPPEVT